MSPGASKVPASKLPSITTSAPAPIAFAMSPEYLSPPSAMTGIPASLATSATSEIAVTWGTPIPATIRVVQMEPGPIPTLRPSAPWAIKSSAASRVAMLPIHKSASILSLMVSANLTTFMLWAWAQSIEMMSAPASSNAIALSKSKGPQAAATKYLPFLSSAALGCWSWFKISLMVRIPTKSPSSLTTGNLSTLFS